MAEIFEICDRVTILRDGKIVKEKNISDTCPDEVIQCMVGRALTDMYPEKNINSGEELLRVENLSNDGFFSNISFRLFKGEILGFHVMGGEGSMAQYVKHNPAFVGPDYIHFTFTGVQKIRTTRIRVSCSFRRIA